MTTLGSPWKDPLALLAALPAFRSVDPAFLRRVLSPARLAALEPGRALCRAGEPAGLAFVVARGLLRQGLLSDSGRAIATDVLSAGDVAGGPGDAEDGCYLCDMSALTRCSVVAVPVDRLARLAALNPLVGRSLLEGLGRRLRDGRKLRALVLERSERRVVGAVLWLAEKLGPRIPLTRADIAELAGVSPETVIRVLSPAAKGGALRSRRGGVEVLDWEALARLAPPAGGSAAPKDPAAEAFPAYFASSWHLFGSDPGRAVPLHAKKTAEPSGEASPPEASLRRL